MSEYYDLGVYSRKISTSSEDAQRWFDRGLNWNYGYNHEEAIECFNKALVADNQCVMAYWGLAYAIGPNYNKSWDDFDPAEQLDCISVAQNALAQANANLHNATEVEKDLVEALTTRYPASADIADFCSYNDAFADAMRQVYKRHGDDLDVATVFAESIMNRTPWLLWNLKTGEPSPGASTQEAIVVLEDAFSRHLGPEMSTHPGLLHMYLHLMEMSPFPEKALRAGDALIDLVPDSGHLIHMATHIDVLCGDYQNVVLRNHKAIQADKKFAAAAGSKNFYTIYRCHNYHFKVYGAMFLGQYGSALDASEGLIEQLSEEVVSFMPEWLEAFVHMKQHVLIRFGKWDEIKRQSQPEDTELYAMTHAMTYYAKTVAHAATAEIDQAVGARAEFRVAKKSVPESRMLFNNTCADLLDIAEAMLEGELSYRRGDHEEAFRQLRRSVVLDDSLPYDEPWGWMQPTRHALGALLLEQGHVDEATDIYRADLGFDTKLARACQHPGNVWSLQGLYECLEKTGKSEEAGLIKTQLDIAKARADVEINYSCYCRGLNL